MSNENEDDAQSLLDVELEALRSIYLNDLEVIYDDGCPLITVQLYPSTADNVDEQYVRMSLILYLPAEYPSIIPDIQIKNSRGLSDEKLQRIMDDLLSKAEEKKGTTMLFELIECAKDHLTAGNRPSCQCAICLYGFTEEDVFTKTKCYHYFHSHCLSRYVAHQLREIETTQLELHSGEEESKKEIYCPVCRVSISFFIPDDYDYPPPTSAVDDNFTVTEDLKQLQNKMADLYKKQKDKGGIIDVEAEKKKFLLEISSVSAETQPVSEAEQPNVAQNITSEEVQCDFGQQRKENSLILSKSKSCNQTRNSTSGSKQNSNWFQRCNRQVKDFNYAPDRTSRTRNNKQQEMRKKGFCEEHSKQHLFQECEENCAYTESGSFVRDGEVGKDKVMKNSETQKTAHSAFGDFASHELSGTDYFNCDTTEIGCSSSMVEYNRNKFHHSGRTHYRPGYHKQNQNYNHRSSFCKQCVSGNCRKHLNITHESPVGDLYNNKIDSNHQHSRLDDNYHPIRTSRYNKKIQNEENSFNQYRKMSNYHGNKQQEEFTSRSNQNGNYRSRQDFRRRLGHFSRCEQFQPNQKELPSRYRESERTVCKDLKDSNTLRDTPIQDIQDSLDQVTFSESSHQHSTVRGRANRRNYAPRKINKLQHEHHRYQNKYKDRPRNSTNSYLEHQSSSYQGQESKAFRNSEDCVSSEVHDSPDRYPKFPFKRQEGKIPEEVQSNNFFPVKDQNSVPKSHKNHGASTVLDSPSKSEKYSPVIDWSSTNEEEGKDTALSNATTNCLASRPPPGFAKKVVYGLPSMKPPPGFSQS